MNRSALAIAGTRGGPLARRGENFPNFPHLDSCDRTIDPETLSRGRERFREGREFS